MYQDDPRAAAKYQVQMNAVVSICRAVRKLDVDWMLATIERAHAVSPIVEPTAYRDGVENLRDQERILRHVKALKDEMDAMEREGR